MGAIISLLLYQPPNPSSYSVSNNLGLFQLTPLYDSNIDGQRELSGTKIPFVFLPVKDKRRKIVILHSHGNATDLGQMLPFLKMLRDTLQVDVCSYDYVGYGPNLHLKATEQRVYDSITAILRFLKTTHNYNPEDIILFGTSLGSGPSVEMASRFKFKGLILQSPFTSVIRTKISRLNLRYFDLFVNLEKIPNINCPILFIHGEKDDLVPVNHTKQLWELLNRNYQIYNPVFVPNAGHNNIIEKFTVLKYVQTLREFIFHLDSRNNISLSSTISEEADLEIKSDNDNNINYQELVEEDLLII